MPEQHVYLLLWEWLLDYGELRDIYWKLWQ